MAVQQSRRTRAAAHTAWRRPLICAVTVAATLCCFVPGAISPMPPYFPAERGRDLVESWGDDSLRNHPPTLLDNAPVLEEAFKIVRESFPWLDELLKREFLDTDSMLNGPFKLELTSEDVERYLASIRPDLRESAATSLRDIKPKDFDEMAKAVLRHTNLNETPSSGTGMNDFIREDDLKREMKTKFRRGYITASPADQNKYSAKPSDVSDDLKTWVQGNIRPVVETDTFEVQLTLHPNVKPNEPEGSIFTFTGTYKKDEKGEFELTKENLEIKDLNYANSTGKLGKEANASTKIKNISPDRNVLDHELENDTLILNFHKGEPLGKKKKYSKGALGLAKMSKLCNPSPCNDLSSKIHWKKRPSFFNRFGERFDPESPPTEDDMRHSFNADVTHHGGNEDYQRDFSLEIQRDAGVGQKQFKSFRIERVYTLMNSDSMKKPFYKKPSSSPNSEDRRRNGKYKAKLRIYQRYTHMMPEEDNTFATAQDEEEDIKINIGFVIDDSTFWGTVCSPIGFNLERTVQLAPPGGKNKTIEVRRHFCYKSDQYTSILHMSHLTREGFNSGSFEYGTKHLFPLQLGGVGFSKTRPGHTNFCTRPVKFPESLMEFNPQSDNREVVNNRVNPSNESDEENSPKPEKQSRRSEISPSINGPDSKGQKNSLLGTTLFDGGLLFLGMITVFVLLAAWLKAPRKGRRERVIEGRVVHSL